MTDQAPRRRLLFATVFVLFALPTLTVITLSLLAAIVGAGASIGSVATSILDTIGSAGAQGEPAINIVVLLFGLSLVALIVTSTIAISIFLTLSYEYMRSQPMQRAAAVSQVKKGLAWAALPLASGIAIAAGLLLQRSDPIAGLFALAISGLPLALPVAILWHHIFRNTA